MIGTGCPSRQELFEYAVGKLPDDLSEDLSEHLGSCPDCQAQLATMDDADDTLIERLRRPGTADPYVEESECDLAMARAMSAAVEPPTPVSEEGSTLPRDLGEYRLLERLGSGGMGTVYRALHTKLDRVVAVKVLLKSRLADDRSIARFEREMKAIGRLEHPNIVHAHDAREIDDMPVLIMQYVEGMDLGELARRLGRLRTAEACELIRQTALGMQCAHQGGLIHRDIKPSNIMLTRTGEVKLLDLGLARFHLASPRTEDVTGTDQAMGTADYMAPEQVSDSRSVDIRADIYGLGCTLFKLLTGQAPFSGPEYRGAFDKMTAHVSKPVPSVQLYAPEVPDKLATAIERMLSKDPNKRFGTPAEVADVLEPFCSGSDLEALAAQAEEAVASGSTHTLAPTPATGSSDVRPRALWKRRIPIASAASLALAAAVVGFASGVVITIRHQGKTTTVEVPHGSDVRVTPDHRIDVTLPRGPESDQAGMSMGGMLGDSAGMSMGGMPGGDMGGMPSGDMMSGPRQVVPKPEAVPSSPRPRPSAFKQEPQHATGRGQPTDAPRQAPAPYPALPSGPKADPALTASTPPRPPGTVPGLPSQAQPSRPLPAPAQPAIPQQDGRLRPAAPVAPAQPPSREPPPAGASKSLWDILPGVGSAREAARKSKSANNLKRIGLAMHNYHDMHKVFPPAYTTDAEGKPLLSWRVLLLPYMEAAELYDQFHLDESWDSPHNRQLVQKMPEVFRSPSDPQDSTNASYFALVGPDTVFTGKEGTRIRDIRDGTSNTLMVVETKRPTPWTKPEDIPYESEKPIPSLGGFYDDGFCAVLCDGSVRFLSHDLDAKALRPAITISDGQRITIF